MTNVWFNPGCALSLYKPEIESTILRLLNRHYGEVALHKTCCHHDPQLEAGALIIGVCPGCDRRFGSLYEGISTISIWEVLDGLDGFPYPDYSGLKVSVQDACPVREKPQVHRAVRNLLEKMNIGVVETELSGTRSVCCGDVFYPGLPIERVHEQMKDRAQAMPCQEVCVYCVTCIKAMHIGGKTPRYLLDLLVGEATEPQVCDTAQWHEQMRDYIDKH